MKHKIPSDGNRNVSSLFINTLWYDRLKVYAGDMGRVLEIFRNNIQHDSNLASWILSCDVIIYEDCSLLTHLKLDKTQHLSYIRALLNEDITIVSEEGELGAAVFYNARMIGVSLECSGKNEGNFILGVISKSDSTYPLQAKH